jgi:hypothetical protein
VSDDGIREMHGVRCFASTEEKETAISVWEDGAWVCVNPSKYMRYMTKEQARYLAAKLYRLSRRIRDRAET